MPKPYDAIIVGAGIMGCSIAYELSRRGWRTLNVDAQADAGAGSTANSCAIVRCNYSTLEGTATAYESFFYWDDWKGYIGDNDPRGMARFIKTGIMLFQTRENGGLETNLKWMDALGIAYEQWDLKAIADRFPVYAHTSYWPPRRPEDPQFGTPSGNDLLGAIWYPTGGYVNDPKLSTQNIAFAAGRHGAEFRYNARVTGIRQAGGRAVGAQLQDGTVLESPVVVNAAGPHSSLLNRLAGVEDDMNIKTRPLRHEVVLVPAPADMDLERFGCPTSDTDIACYSRPEHGHMILCGSEDPECDPQQWVEDPDHFDRSLTAQAKAQAYRLALRIPTLGIPSQLSGLVDLYDVTQDWIPIYDRSDLDGFYLCVGTSGNQYKNAPVVGKMMAELIEACEKGHPHDDQPLDFHLEYIDREVSLGFFSRRRKINEASSFSVLG